MKKCLAFLFVALLSLPLQSVFAMGDYYGESAESIDLEVLDIQGFNSPGAGGEIIGVVRGIPPKAWNKLKGLWDLLSPGLEAGVDWLKMRMDKAINFLVMILGRPEVEKALAYLAEKIGQWLPMDQVDSLKQALTSTQLPRCTLKLIPMGMEDQDNMGLRWIFRCGLKEGLF